MLQIRDICKEYRTENLIQKALDGVCLNLRDSEFVAILGPSGSGKTTLLNIIGGLDRYDSGDLIINGISTKKYKDRDWDSYRNHTIGFVFQSYNLIPHQTILANVELALTISGVGKGERRKRAQKALTQVGLGEQLHKKPNQLSGGQMQRVAIARALVNDPDILLADEPTGALDSETSVQVMELLKEVAKDRLVVMVTHNPELAYEYATRIVNLKDGHIISDSNPFAVDDATLDMPKHKNMGKSSMSFLTALSLSFNNLKTKKARTLLTAFAGSIGIIGIALILSLSSGVNKYIEQIEKETLSEYPLQIQSTGFDFASIMVGNDSEDSSNSNSRGKVHILKMVTNLFSSMDSNDLKSLKTYLDSGKSGIEKYTNAVEYSYNLVPQIYKENGDEIRQVNPDRSFEAMGLGNSSNSSNIMSSMMSTNVFYEMPENKELYENQYDVKAGRWPENYNECVLVLTSGGGMSDFLLYTLGLRDPLELDEMVQEFINEENIKIPDDMGSYSYDDMLGITFRLVNSADYYQYDSQYHVWTDKTDDKDYMKKLVENGEKITIVGVVQPSENSNAAALNTGICYPASLTRHIAEEAEKKEIVKEQLANPSVNVFTGKAFGESGDQNSPDMKSMFTVDEDKLQQAFGFDENALSSLSGSFDFADAFKSAGGNIDLSNMIDLDSISVDLPKTEGLNLGNLMNSLDIKVSEAGMTDLAGQLLAGYQEYAKDHPEADLSGLKEDFETYLGSSAAQEILNRNMMEIIQSGEGVTLTEEQLQDFVREVLTGFLVYADENGYTDSDLYSDYLNEYLQTSQGQEIIQRYAQQIFSGIMENISISPDQIEKLTGELVEGYQEYAPANGLTDPSAAGQNFVAYLSTDAGRKILTDGLAGMVDTDGLENQIQSAAESYMKNAFTSYGNAIGSVLEARVSAAMQQVMSQLATAMENAMSQAMTQVGSSLQNAVSIDADAFADAFQMNMTGEEFTELMMSMGAAENETYDSNLKSLGYVDFAVPSEIDIYPKNFESKEYVVNILDDYNSRMEKAGKEEQVITYTDVVGTMMSSVTDIIDIISYVLIAFVAISLLVSSIMIGVITYISVLERKKEIGILRAIGASKGNISEVFNAETFIIGLCAGLIGIGITLIILIPVNFVIHYFADTNDINAYLPIIPALILIILSVLLTLIGGLIPSKKAAKSDPVTALRTE